MVGDFRSGKQDVEGNGGGARLENTVVDNGKIRHVGTGESDTVAASDAPVPQTIRHLVRHCVELCVGHASGTTHDGFAVRILAGVLLDELSKVQHRSSLLVYPVLYDTRCRRAKSMERTRKAE